MKRKIDEFKKAIKLRKIGKSLNEISHLLSVSKSSVSYWCKGILLTEKQKNKLCKNRNYEKGAIANKIKRQKELKKIEIAAIKEIKKLRVDDIERLRDIGTMIYWAEGTKNKVVDITNSDPELIKVAMAWFRKVCKIPENRFRASVFYHSGQNEYEIKKYWSKITEIPLNQFHKSIFKKEGTGQRKKILYNGTCKIRIGDRNLLHRIKTWISRFYLR